MTFVLSLGGSIVAPPEGPDTDFLARFRALCLSWLRQHPDRRLILVVGGGGPARLWQKACRTVWADLLAGNAADSAPSDERGAASVTEGAAPVVSAPDFGALSNDALDWIGIAATRLNAQLVKAIFGDLCSDPVVTDPSAQIAFSGRILVASGWKPGFSTDFDAVWLAGRFGANTVLNLSNIAQVYTADPKLDPKATAIDHIGWPEFRTMVGSTWSPGANLPFDPIASAKAETLGLQVICAAGRDLDNLARILEGQPYIGTLIGEAKLA